MADPGPCRLTLLRLARPSFWAALLLPFVFFGWILLGERTIGNDYTYYPRSVPLSFRFLTDLGIEPMWFPHQAGGFPIGGLFFAQYFHLPAALSVHLPGYWTGAALLWTSVRHLLLFALLHGVYYLGYRRAAVLGRAESFLLAGLSAYSLRHLDLLRYAIGLEAAVYAECAFLLVALHICRPSRVLLASVAVFTQLLLTSGYPVVIPYVLLAVLICAPTLLDVAGRQTALTRGLQAMGAALVGALLAAPHWMTLWEWFAVNDTRVARPRLAWAAMWPLRPADIPANLSYPWAAQVDSAFTGSTLHSIVLVVVVTGLLSRIRRTWPLVAGMLLVFLYALGQRTPVQPFFFAHVPLFSSLRVPGRILVVLPLISFTGILWLRRLSPGWRPWAGPSVRVGVAAGFVCVLLGTVGFTELLGPWPNPSPSALSDFWTVGHRLLWIGVGLVAAQALGWAAVSRVAMIVLMAATAVQVGMLMRHGTWTQETLGSPTRQDFHSASYLPLHGGAPLIAFNELNRKSEGTSTVPYAQFLRETGVNANCVLPIHVWTRDLPVVLPFYLSDAVVCVKSREEARARLAAADGCLQDPLTRVYLMAQSCTDGKHATASGLVSLNRGNRIRALTPNLTILEVDSPRDAVLVTPYVDVTGNWSGSIDGTPAPLVGVDGAFLGLRVPPGRHTLAVRYFSRHLVVGYRIAAATALLLAIGIIMTRARHRRSLAALAAATLSVVCLFAYRNWERDFCLRARRETMLNHQYPRLLDQQLARWGETAHPTVGRMP